MEIVIDNRERELLRLFGTTCSSENLELGDAVIKLNGNTVAVFERKEWKDLADSIKDGRYHNQKKRLLEAYDRKLLYYIIEGPGDFSEGLGVSIHGIEKSTLLSCMYGTMIRDDIKVFRTASVADTHVMLQGFMSRFAKYDSITTPTEHQVVKSSKRINSPEDYFVFALCQVPGVNLKTAKAIAAKYSTLPRFVTSLRGEQNKLQVLKDITTLETKRRLSETVCKKILEFLIEDYQPSAPNAI